ncbi:MAG: hypothetical protein IKN26_06495, partial [Eubacterium sp.]|nr:hypothetical protein [Eubacterium sp.]
MNKVRIADFNISVDSGIEKFNRIFRNELSDFENADIQIEVTDADVEYERIRLTKDKTIKFETTFRVSVILRKIADALGDNDSFLLHG